MTVARGSGGFERRQKFEMREDSVGREEEASLCVGLVSAALVVCPLQKDAACCNHGRQVVLLLLLTRTERHVGTWLLQR